MKRFLRELLLNLLTYAFVRFALLPAIERWRRRADLKCCELCGGEPGFHQVGCPELVNGPNDPNRD